MPGAMTAASLALRHFAGKAKDMLSLFYQSVYQNLTMTSKQAASKGVENAQLAMKRAMSLTDGLDPEE